MMNTSHSSKTEQNSGTEKEKLSSTGKPTLERIFEQILAYCEEQNHIGAPVDQEKSVSSKNCDKMSAVTSGDCSGCSTNTVSNCNCKTTCRNSESNRIPAFSLSFGNSAQPCSCRSSACSGTQSVQNPRQVHCTNPGSNDRVLQIHLPESSQEPCRILISSDQDQFTVKYLKQGQQFSFSASCDDESMQEQRTTREDFNELSPKTVSKSRSDRQDASEVRSSGKRKPDFSDENLRGVNDDERMQLHKKQRDAESAESNFYDLLFKRRMEEEQKKGSETAIEYECSDSEDEDEETFDFIEPEGKGNDLNDEAIEMVYQGRTLQQEGTARERNSEPLADSLFSKEEVSEMNNREAHSADPSSHDNFSQSSADFLHRGSSTNRGRFKCQYCTETFEQRVEYITHQNTHANDRPYNCPLCNVSFKQRRSLKYHIKHHDGTRPYKCTHCDKAFKEKYHLTVHIRTHTGERPFACTLCGKAFKQTNELTSHIRTHTGEKPYNCSLCDKWFKRRSQLYHHNQSHMKTTSLLAGYNNEGNPDTNTESRPAILAQSTQAQ